VFARAVSVREHASQHEAIGDLPLVTRSATVTTVEHMDRDRRQEVRRRITGWLDRRGIAGEIDVPSDVAEWPELVDSLSTKGFSGLARRTATLAERATRPRPMLVRTTLETDENFEYLAGQYIGLRYAGNSRAYSLASSPLADELELCIRRVPDGRLSPQLCEDLSSGDSVTVRGPHGDLLLQDPSQRDMVFLATGTGVAPFKGMIDYIFETDRYRVDGTERDVWLFLGAAWKDDAPYMDAFQRLADEENRFHFVPCLSRESYLSDWDGETDYVQHALLKYVDEGRVTTAMGQRLDDDLSRNPPSQSEKPLDPTNMEVYACGINAMVYSLVKSVRRLGVPPEYIESEGFG
jgi:ferredoxin-NADP reductase